MNEMAKDNSQRAFTAFLAFSGEDQVIENLAFDQEDSFFEKRAGIAIYQPTVENIEKYVEQYLRSETKNSGATSDIFTHLDVKAFDNFRNEHVKDASGEVAFSVNKHEVELPFLIVDGEFIPFDVIQVGKQRVPYSRENLMKVVRGLQAHDAKLAENGIEEFKPYLGVSNPVNPSSSVGFLGDVLRIQEQHSNRGATGGAYWVTASSEFENLLEKLAALKPATEDDWKQIENNLLFHAVQARKEKLQKHADELASESDEKFASLYKVAAEIPWKNASTLPHGTVIHFPEITERQLSMSKGIVLAKFKALAGHQMPKNKIVLSEDGRIKILAPGDKFLCVIPTHKDYLNITQNGMKSVDKGEMFMAFNGQEAIYPMTVDYISTKTVSTRGEIGQVPNSLYEKRQDAFAILSEPSGILKGKTLMLNPIMSEIGETAYGSNFSTIPLTILNGTAFDEFTYTDFITAKSKELGVCDNPSIVASMFGKYSIETGPVGKDRKVKNPKVITTCGETKIIPIHGFITRNAETPEDVTRFDDNMVDPDLDFVKSAGTEDYVEIRLANKDDDTYNVTIHYADKSQKVSRVLHRQYKGMPYSQVREVLKALSFNITKVSELMTKAKNENYLRVSLPENATPDMLQGSMLQGQVAQAVKKMRTAIFNPDFNDQISREVLGRVIDTMPTSPLDPKALSKTLNKKAETYKALTVLLEKQAIEVQSEILRDAAILTATATYLDEKIAESITGKSEYPALKKMAKEIISLQDFLEKTAFDLLSLKTSQIMGEHEVVPMSRLSAAIESIDHLHKLAFYLAQ